MNYKNLITGLIFLTALNAPLASASTCRSGVAATAGAQAAYENEVNQINQQAANSQSSSDIMGKCISGITSINIMPVFPDLGSIWSDMVNKVCKSASDSISSASNAAISNINDQINGLMNGVSNAVSDTASNVTSNVTDTVSSATDNFSYSTLYK